MRSDSLLFIQIYTDEHVAPVLATLLRQRGYVAQSAQEAGMLGRDDEEHLAYAMQNNMAILTFNGKDFDRLAREWVALGREHAGIVISPQLSRDRIGELLHSLIRLLDSLTADEIRNQVVYLQRFGAHRPKRAADMPVGYVIDAAPG